jgi:recombination protein RecT
MAEQTAPTRALTQYDRLKTMVRADDVRARFTDILGERAPAFLASVLSAVATNDNLKDCEPGSILTSALKAAVLDLPIDQNIGFAWIIPYNMKGTKKANFQIGYKGFVQLALRTNQYESINAIKIYEGEEVKVDRLSGRITLNGHKTGDKVVGYVAYFKLLGGFEKYLYLTVEDIEEHKVKYAKGYDRPDSAWKTNFDGMALKTVLKNLLTHYGIMSIQMQKAVATDDQAEAEEAPEESTVIDGSFMEQREEEQAQEEPPAPPEEPQGETDEAAAQLAVEQKVIDNVPHAMNILKKRKDDCPLNKVQFIRAYAGWRALDATSAKAAEYANQGETPK